MKAILLMFCLNTAASLTDAGDFETSQKILNFVKPNKENHNRYSFYKAANAFALNQKDECLKWSNYVLDSFKPETRYYHVASLMISEAEHWKENDIADIGRDMKVSADRLASAKGGNQTQGVQKKIISKLDKLIKEQEDAKNGKGKDGKDGKDSKEQPGMPGSRQDGPASDSMPNGDMSGKGKVDEKQLKKLAQNWGSLPPDERAKAIQELTRDLPPKYKPMIEEYFKSLSKLPQSP